MDTLTIHSRLVESDWRALCLAAGRRMSEQMARQSWIDRAAPFIGWLVFTATIVGMLSARPPLVRPLGIAILGALFALVCWWIARRRMNAARLDENGVFLGDQTFEFSATGFRARRANSDTTNLWALVNDIQEGDAHLFLWIDRMSAYVLPARDLPPGMTLGDLAATLRGFVGRAADASSNNSPVAAEVAAPREPEAVAEPPAISSSSIDSPTPMAGASPVGRAAPAPSLWSELRALTRLFGWSIVDRTALPGREVTLAFLGALTLALWLGLARSNFSRDAVFTWWGVPSVAVGFGVVVILSWLMARFSSPRLALRHGMLLVLGLAPLIVTAAWLARSHPSIAVFSVMGVLAIEAFWYLKNGLRAISGAQQLKALLLSIVTAALMLYGSTRALLLPDFWYEAQDDDELSLQESRANELLVFEQSSRIDALIASMKPRAPGRPNAYFVGFAGFGPQRVFAQEIDLAARSLGTRYGADGHSLQLVNDARDGTRHPFATPAALRHALSGVASRMNVEEDVLFLSISSHGSERATVSVDSEYGYWNDLAAEDLSSMLRDAKIRWKVIVISACHAGSFIDALKDDGTIILTAAAADRSSFGCSDDSELTYFGEALYQSSMPDAATLRDAFERARELIAKREQAEGLDASNPQAFFGEAITAKLAELEPRRDE